MKCKCCNQKIPDREFETFVLHAVQNADTSIEWGSKISEHKFSFEEVMNVVDEAIKQREQD